MLLVAGTYCPPQDSVNGKQLNSCLGDLYSVNWMEDADTGAGLKRTLEDDFNYIKQVCICGVGAGRMGVYKRACVRTLKAGGCLQACVRANAQAQAWVRIRCLKRTGRRACGIHACCTLHVR